MYLSRKQELWKKEVEWLRQRGLDYNGNPASARRSRSVKAILTPCGGSRRR
jgi:hypothetical protein